MISYTDWCDDNNQKVPFSLHPFLSRAVIIEDHELVIDKSEYQSLVDELKELKTWRFHYQEAIRLALKDNANHS